MRRMVSEKAQAVLKKMSVDSNGNIVITVGEHTITIKEDGIYLDDSKITN